MDGVRNKGENENENFYKYFSKFETGMGNFWCSQKVRGHSINV
jgi:hypothetical protein